MYRRSSLGLMGLAALASCVPPHAAADLLAQSAPPPVPHRPGIAPGPILARMPLLPEMPLAPPLAADTAPLQGAPAFIAAAQSSDDSGRALECLTAAVYYEARSEPLDGQRAVAQVVLNRVRNPAFPASVCGVVYQGSYRTTGCQFSFTCDGSLLRPREPGAWAVARQIAAAALAGDVYAPVGPAMYYHTTAVHPFWENALTAVTTIGAHIFYRWGGGLDNGFEFRQRYAGLEPVGAGASGWDQAQQVLLRYGVSESRGVTVHRGGAVTAVATIAGDAAAAAGSDAAGAAPAPQPATLATVAGVTIHMGGSEAAGASAAGVRLHLGGGTKPAASPAPVETVQAAPPPSPAADGPAASAPASAAARD